MSDTTFDEARRCPTCNELGSAVGKRPAPERYMGSFHIFRCENQRCAKKDRDWIVQVRPDGTIPDPTMVREKSFPIEKGTTKERIAKARASVDNSIKDSMKR